jgi:uncharacterized protein (TIGR02271 family)
VREAVPASFEQLVQERVPAREDDSGEIEILPDGSISIPLYEEEVVVTKRTVLRERVVIRKRVATRTERIREDLRREHVEIEADRKIDVIDDADHVS